MPKETTSRWSDVRYTNLNIPSYVPSEALVAEDGQFIRAFLLRVLATDMQRMLATHTCDAYFCNIPLEPEYDANGNRTNTPEDVVMEKRLRVMDDISKLLRTYVERAEYAANKSKDINHRIYFTHEQIETGDYGALIGPRGQVHQDLEKETKCHIVLVGRGITNPLKDTNPNAAAMALEDPHVRITAKTEEDLQKAAEKIEWILSDEPDAVEFRENNRRHMAQVDGRYDPRTWMTVAEKKKAAAQKAAAAAGAGEGGAEVGKKRPREEGGAEAAEAEEDAELNEFLEDL
ncbi:putative branch point binding protein [Leptomonas pyrrhocoris]|uniref:Branchpoint-bridging protein n=1 Tax=Leptomonas pyrrhocoris TaxID=157538 RepID=A0A0M9G3J4_LEPPY|nr:putative branch point binding protein [Leptomonas pyrrhocoris]KPA81635.1 putative branch point binding protein [Leptomonas pyrrhocoris]|eukprot:XP_015660074.1 putative branch point binding protein [Leptomonas pyrrhocoris]